jgi:hypothetical protein
MRRTIAAAALAAVLATLAACGNSSTSDALHPSAANVSACRAFTLTIDNSAPLQGLAMSLLSAGTSVSYRLRHDLAVFITASKSGSSHAVADGMRVRADCRSIKAPVP